MAVTATEAKNRLGQVLDEAQVRPVVIEKAGRPHSVVMSIAMYEALQRAARAEPAGGVSEPGKRFYAEHKEWVDAMNADQERNGLWSDGLRTW